MQWEYQVTDKPQAAFDVGDNPIPTMWTEHLNEQGAEGWELVQGDGPFFLWKRPVTPSGLEPA